MQQRLENTAKGAGNNTKRAKRARKGAPITHDIVEAYVLPFLGREATTSRERPHTFCGELGFEEQRGVLRPLLSGPKM